MADMAENTNLQTYKDWQTALANLKIAEKALVDADAKNAADITEYRNLIAIYDRRETLSCAGGSGGYSYTIPPDTGLNCSSSSVNLGIEVNRLAAILARINELKRLRDQYEGEAPTSGRSILQKAVQKAKDIEDAAKKAYDKERIASLTPQQLSEYQESINSAQATQTKSKLTAYIIVGGVILVVLGIVGWVIYKYGIKQTIA